MKLTYIEAIGRGFPTIQCHSFGDGSIYEDIIWDSGPQIPSKQTLDAWIDANPITENRIISVLAFRKRFTQTEKIDIELASMNTIDDAASALAARLRVMNSDIIASPYIDLYDPEIIDYVVLLEENTIIQSGRSDEILNSPITTEELP